MITSLAANIGLFYQDVALYARKSMFGFGVCLVFFFFSSFGTGVCAGWVGVAGSSGCFVQISAARCSHGITLRSAGKGRRVWRALL